MPSQMTEYLVLERDAEDRFTKLGTFPGRDHDHAIDAALEERDPADRRGCFSAVPARNWREYEKETEVSYRTTTRQLGAPESAVV